MRRGVWFAAGAATGVYGVVRIRRFLEIFTADGLRDRVGAAFVGARMMREEFAQGMTDAETDLRERYELAAAKERAVQAADGRRGDNRELPAGQREPDEKRGTD